MQSTTHLWHPISEAKLYESAGSRTSFNEKWSRDSEHSFVPMPAADAEEKRKDEDGKIEERRDEDRNAEENDLQYLNLQKAVCDRAHGHC
jgi:hypothetical protein